MEVFTSEVRTLQVQLGPGERLVAALTRVLVREEASLAWARGVGRLQEAELTGADGGARRIGAGELLVLEGTLRPEGNELRVTVAAAGEVFGGRLDEAVVAAVDVELRLVSLGDALEVDEGDAGTPSSVGWGDVASASESGANTGAGGNTGWADVAAASAEATKTAVMDDALESWAEGGAKVEARKRQEFRRESAKERVQRLRAEGQRVPGRRDGVRKGKLARAAAEATVPAFRPEKVPTKRERKKDLSFLEEPIIEAGELVDHRQFGRCLVERVNDDGGLMIKLPNGRRRLIRVDVLEVQEPTEDAEGRLVYPLRPKRKS
ncbi:MAG: DUF296 domain-containing protein [Myxococcota bacterium]